MGASAYGLTTLFQGRTWHSDLGMYYYRARWYLPEGGVFGERDIFNYQNPYSFLDVQPINLIDPFGWSTGCGWLKNHFGNPSCTKDLWELVPRGVVDRIQQVESIVGPYREPIETFARLFRVPPEMVGAMILAEQRDQRWTEDPMSAIDTGIRGTDRSYGLGQIQISTAKKYRLLPPGEWQKIGREYRAQNHPTARAGEPSMRRPYNAFVAEALMIPQNNIFGIAKYLRIVADMGYKKWKAGEFDGTPQDPYSRVDESLTDGWLTGNSTGYQNKTVDLSELATSVWVKPSAIMLMGSEYTSLPWDMFDPDTGDRGLGTVQGWGLLVLQSFEDVVRSRLFSGEVTRSYQLHSPDLVLRAMGMP
jgi:RHS repeat-associated protein